MTINEMIGILEKAKKDSPIGGNTVCAICVPDFEYQEISNCMLVDVNEEDKAGILIIESIALNDELSYFVNYEED